MAYLTIIDNYAHRFDTRRNLWYNISNLTELGCESPHDARWRKPRFFLLISNKEMTRMTSTAILVDGGFYRKRALHYFGKVSPEERAKELVRYCAYHLRDKDNDVPRHLYRIFYYDCPPVKRTVYNPILKMNVDLGNNPTFNWTFRFFETLASQRKVAIRRGRLSNATGYRLKTDSFKKLCAGTRDLSQLTTEEDLTLEFGQKGVDMRLGLDIAHLAYKRLVDQIILISGDSDFVPAAKQARRGGIDFILDPMHSTIKDDLFEHIDGIRTPTMPNKTKKK